MIRALLALAVLLGTPAVAAAQAVIVVLSADQVTISSNYTGTDLTVFGALELDRPADEADLAVVLRGPRLDVTARRKERVLGLWINRASETFYRLPAFYALHTTAPLETMAEPALLAGLGLGLDTVIPQSVQYNDRREDFAEAIIRLQQNDGRYDEEIGAVARPSDTIFRTTFALPADIPIGSYTVEVLLFEGGEVVASAELPLEISKSGTEQLLYDASRSQSWFYAISVVAIAISAGWLGGIVFRRD